jgi:signal transduction histidine kinase
VEPKHRVLILDDDPNLRKTLSDILRVKGYIPVTTATGEAALDEIKQETPAVALLDLRLEHMSGLEVLKKIKKRSPSTECVLLTGYASQASAIEAINLGAYSYVQKPYDVEQLLVTVRRAIEKGKAEEALRQHSRDLAMLNRAGQALSSTLDLDQVLVTVTEEIRRLLDVVAASVWLIDPETDELVCRQATGAQSEVVRGWRLAPGQGLAGLAARSGESMIVADAQADERHFKGVDQETRLPLRSILTIPLRVKQDMIGVIQVVDTEADRFDTTDLALLESLSTTAGTAIDNAQLVKALHQRAAELQARNEELDAFAHTVAHDLKAPLALIVGFAQVLDEDYAALPDEVMRRHLRRMAQGGRKMSNIIDELLLLAEMRKAEVEMRPLDMASIVAEAQQRLAHQIEASQAEIILPETWPVALGYGPWVEEVWANYLSNALKYGGQPPRVELGFDEPASQQVSESASQRIDGSTEPVLSTAEGLTEVSMVRFWIRDNGPGLTPEEQARLFTPFTRLDQVRVKGHGLGLSIVGRIVEKLGGEVDVESKVGQGSTFTFTLPSHSPTLPEHVSPQHPLEQLEHGPALPGERREAQQSQHRHTEVIDAEIERPGHRVTPAGRGPEVPELPQKARDHPRGQQPQCATWVTTPPLA